MAESPMSEYRRSRNERQEPWRSVNIGLGVGPVGIFTEPIDDPSTPANEERHHIWPRALLLGAAFASLFIFARAVDNSSSSEPSNEPTQEIYPGHDDPDFQHLPDDTGTPSTTIVIAVPAPPISQALPESR